MSRTKTRIWKNLEYAQRWLDRAIKDFEAFHRLVPFDKRTRKTIRCSDPALAVYLLQQSVEKAVKAAAIASGQYKTKDFTNYYKHNSLALILNLNKKIITKIDVLGLKPVTDLMGIDLADGNLKLRDLENQVMGGTLNSMPESEKKVNFKEESIHISPEVIDDILNRIMKARTSILDIIRSVFSHLPELGIRKGFETVENPEEIVQILSDKITSDLKFRSPSEAQLKAPVEFTKILSKHSVQLTDELNRTDMINAYLGLWSFSIALYLLTYLTFAHESPSRYPRKPGKVDKLRLDKLGCEDYDEGLGIVNRIGRIGYVTSLTLNDMKQELEAIAFFFATKSVTSSTGPKGGSHRIP